MRKLKFLMVPILAVCVLLSALCLTACGGKLPVPPDVELNLDNYTLSWTKVDNARGYEVWVRSADNGKTFDKTYTVSRSRASLNLDDLAENDYDVCVRASAGSSADYRDSDWSAVISFSKDYYSGCSFTLINNATEYEVTGWSKPSDGTTAITITETYRDKPVVGIGDKAFQSRQITSVYVEGENLRYVGDNAFYSCSYLTEIHLPDSVASIGSGAFHSCKVLKEFVMPAGVTEIESSTFLYCRQLESIDFGNVTKIGDSAFYGCSETNGEGGFVTLDIPDSVTEIGEKAFALCYNLESVTIGSGCETVGNYAFQSDRELKTVKFREGVTEDGEEKSALDEIGKYAFYNCSELESVTLPEGLTTISPYAFNKDSALEKINIPSSVEKIGESAFVGTALYKNQSEKMFVYVGDDAPYDETGKSKAESVIWLLELNGDNVPVSESGTSYDIGFDDFGSDTVGIADNAFLNATGLGKVYIPENIRYIGDYAFFGSSFYTVIIQGSTSDRAASRTPVCIGSYSFSSMSSLSTLQFNDNSDTTTTRYSAVKSIGDHAFYNSTSVTDSVRINNSLEHIGGYAFSRTSIKASDNGDGVIYVGTSSGATAKWAVGYSSDLEANITLDFTGKDVYGVADYAFSQATGLQVAQSVNLATYVGEGAFYCCSALQTVYVSESITDIADYTFYGCSSLTRLGNSETYYSKLETIGRSAFYKCSTLAEFNLSATKVNYIGKYAFYGCDDLRKMPLGNYLTEIDDFAFYKSGIREIEFPSTLERIGENAFYKCASLTNVTFDDTPEDGEEHPLTIEDNAFYKCEALEEIYLPGKVKEIGDYAFYKCISVKSLTLGLGVEKIGVGSFGSLPITSIAIPSSVREIGNYAFYKCEYVTSVAIPSSVEIIGEHAFYGMYDATFYTDADDYLGQWSTRLNSSNRPMVWGCVLSEDCSYVVSVTITEDTFSNVMRLDPTEDDEDGYERLCGAPTREGYIFVGWATTPGGGAVYTAEGLDQVPVGTTVYTVWREIVVEESEEPDMS